MRLFSNKIHLSILVVLYSILSHGQSITFSTQIVDDDFDGPGGVFVSDINKDGYPDVIGAGIDANTIAWWQNDTVDQQYWQKQVIDDSFNGAMYVFAADIDNDSLIDVLGAAFLGNEIAWWKNEGGDSIHWTKHTIESGFNHAHEIMSYDIDIDGDMDVIGVSAGNNLVTWYENDGNYPVNWVRHVIDSLFTGARSVDAGDIDGDGDIDIAGAALDDNEVAWWRNDGGNPIQWTKFSINTNFINSHKVQIKDIDLDGDSDILATAYSSGLSWWENNGVDTITWEKHLISGNNTMVIAWAVDLDHDLDNDIIGTAQGSGYIAFWENEGNNSLIWDFNFMESFDGAWPLHYGDIDKDGDVDLICGGNDANQIKLYKNDLITGKSEQTLNNDNFIVNFYPNPTYGIIYIQISDKVKLPLDFELTDISGNTIKLFKIISGSEVIDISGLQKGIYFISSKNSNYFINEKLIIN